MKSRLILIMMIMAAGMVFGQESKLHLGTELDLVPFVNQGFYTSIYVASEAWKFRLVNSQLKLPDFVVKKGYTKNHVKAYALIVDYYPNSKSFKQGLWIGSGFEYWDNEITQKSSLENKAYQQWIYTLGAGYNLPIYKTLYINPWVAGHLNMDIDQEIKFSDKNLRLDVFTPEISCKIGVYF